MQQYPVLYIPPSYAILPPMSILLLRKRAVPKCGKMLSIVP